MRALQGSVIACLLLSACGDPEANPADRDGGSTDAADAYTGPVFMCWPDIAPVPQGTVTLGAGGGQGFAPMPETLPLEYGIQGGFMVKVWPRMTGFIVGRSPINAPENPFTRIRATLLGTDAALQLPGNCASREWYEPNAVGGYDLHEEFAVVFNTCWQSDRLIGAQIQLDVELMDATGAFATERRIITATEPVGDHPVGITQPSCGR